MSRFPTAMILYLVLITSSYRAVHAETEEKQKWTGHVVQSPPASKPANEKPAAPVAPSAALQPYMQNLGRKIKHNWFPPTCLSKVTVIRFAINKDGELVSSKIVKSCGIQIGDDAAMRAIRNAAPYKPLPAGVTNANAAPTSKTKVNATEFEFDFDFRPEGDVRLANTGK